MPIRPSERARYPRDWKAISLRIRKRDGNACRFCHAPNGVQIFRLRAAEGTWRAAASLVRPHLGEDASTEYLAAIAVEWRGPIKVVLTVAHLDHVPENVSDANLVALCQRCHLRYDRALHQQNARATRRGRLAAGELFP